jgi:hypothetical protein
VPMRESQLLMPAQVLRSGQGTISEQLMYLSWVCVPLIVFSAPQSAG